MSWTSIVFYLWKNTCRRWLESPISPLSKILLVFVVSFFSIVILSLFKGVEKEIADRLARRDLNTVSVTELVSSREGRLRLRQSLSEERMWTKRYGAEKFQQVWRAGATAEWKDSRISIFGYTNELLFPDLTKSPGEIPTAMLFLREGTDRSREVYEEVVELNGRELALKVTTMPEWMKIHFQDRAAIVGPMVLLEGLLEEGFVSYSIAELDSLEEVLAFESEMRAYHRSESNRIEILSAANILRDLERFQVIQGKVKIALVGGCGFVLAVIMASMAWLEFREDQYVLALLRSFGTQRIWLFIHSLWENVVLVAFAIAMIPMVWSLLLGSGVVSLARFGFPSQLEVIAWNDLQISVLAALVGCLLATLPVALGLRKQVGLVLS